MERAEIEEWLISSRQVVGQQQGLPDEWWPTTNADGQARASAWALAFFVQGALDTCSAPTLEMACSAGASKPLNRRVIDDMWIDGTARTHVESQVLVDFSVHNWEASSPVQVTGESETYASHGVGDSLSTSDDYSWDFYKLLVIPSATRLFFARVGGHGGESSEDRCQQLAATLVGLVDWYGPALLRPHDELGVAIVPSAKKNRTEAIALWLDRGRLRRERIGRDFF